MDKIAPAQLYFVARARRYCCLRATLLNFGMPSWRESKPRLRRSFVMVSAHLQIHERPTKVAC